MWDFYIAAPLFTHAEKDYNSALYARLKRNGYSMFLPQLYQDGNSMDIFQQNLSNLLISAGIIVICDGADMDSGTSWEAGHFYGRGKIIALRTDFRKSGDDPESGINLMISKSADHIFTDRNEMCDWIINNVSRWRYLDDSKIYHI